jgi:choline/glycine/proline betaine transport protein
VVLPACHEVSAELHKQGLQASVHSGEDGRAWLAVAHGAEVDFRYEVRPRALNQPNFNLHDSSAEPLEARKYFRAEVHLSEGGQDYDLMGWAREEVIGDILDQYERHLHFLHLVR